ncbi:VIT family protein [Methyloversatilis sp.]|uniref:VIT1/CCC1 transporter family protein n=1 Tax=Methyloversatilis sp. TaxID=2569862 RepID=UPI002733E1F4|nr:VIT family protein [Methyloversatilis sp.]MDP2868070.1 VIT family protein [Methyloversatilis sp.]MDP3287080.1 VIT family protein [Methyloversatilis sp.]MDP3454063.1 VIT family protein [Methyloversatilis sp.]MDP3578229.1 VIT family protein [Methyloversatilis sp.]
MTRAPRKEMHRSHRSGWLRAAVLGANDGVVSTASLIAGVAAANATPQVVLLTGVAGLVAGAMSMAAGEYVSVHSQADTERADIEQERREQENDPVHEMSELAAIYVGRGLDPSTADEVARQLMERDALQAHARDELGIPIDGQARPLQAALTSALAFAAGAGIPLLAVVLTTEDSMTTAVTVASLVSLMGLGAVAAQVGGASPLRGALRVTFWGAAAMGLTALVGSWFGVAV